MMQRTIKELLSNPIDVGALVLLLGVPLGLLVLTSQNLLFAAALYINIAALSIYDFLAYRLPNLLTLSFFLVAVAYAFAASPLAFETHAIGAVAGFAVPVLVNAVYRRLRGRDGIGMGDAKLLAGCGMLVGWPSLPLILAISSILGLGYALLTRHDNQVTGAPKHIPFGPFIGFAGYTIWLNLAL